MIVASKLRFEQVGGIAPIFHHSIFLCGYGSGMPKHRVRRVRLAEELDLFGAELDLDRRHRLLDMRDLAGADDGRGQPRLMQQPRVTDLSIA